MGFLEGVFKVGLTAVFFLGGYAFSEYVHGDKDYTIRRVHDTPYLVDKHNNEQLRIEEETFQVGSLEHRVEGILQDPRLPIILQELEQKYD